MKFRVISLLLLALAIVPVAHAQCDLNATTANFAAQLTAAKAGQSVCLATGNYGDWGGISKSITIRNAPGATPKMRFAFTNNQPNQDWTMDGVAVAGGDVSGPTKNITVKNGQVTKELSFFPTAKNNRCSNCPAMNGNNIVLDNMDFNQADNSGQPVNYEGRLNFVDGSTPAGITVKNSKFHDRCADGVQFSGGGNGVTIGPNNEFYNLNQGSCSAHVDSIQQVGADSVGPVIDGNYFHNSTDGAVAYDYKPHGKFTNNVLWALQGPYINLAYSSQDVIAHNTSQGPIVCNSTHNWNSTGQKCTVAVTNNIFPSVTVTTSDSTGTTGAPVCSFNLYSGSACPGNNPSSIKGSPTFAGGSNPTSYAGFILAATSLGRGAGSDGKDMGIAEGSPPPPGVNVTVAPPTVSLVYPAMQQFTATVTGTTNTAVTWTATCGAVSIDGAFVAPNANSTCTVRATSVADNAKSGTATATVTTAPPPDMCGVGDRCAVVDPIGANIRSSALNNDFGPKIGAAPMGSTFKVLTVTNARIPQTPAGVVWKQVDFDDPSLPTGYMGSDNMKPTSTPPPSPTLIINCPIAKAGFTASNFPSGTMLTITGTMPGAPPVSCTTLP